MFHQRVWIGRLAVACSLTTAVLACGDDTNTGGSGGNAGNPNQGGQGGQPSQGGTMNQGGGGSPGTGGMGGMTGGTGGMGGEGGGPVITPGPPGQTFVSAGGVVTSPNYKLVYSMGESTINANKMSSPSYRLQGGLVGATGTLP
ncbi:MAG: hypothetical protein U0271_23125 [Polyangiaceae bacterium]